jgi:hypothetical protein
MKDLIKKRERKLIVDRFSNRKARGKLRENDVWNPTDESNF